MHFFINLKQFFEFLDLCGIFLICYFIRKND